MQPKLPEQGPVFPTSGGSGGILYSEGLPRTTPERDRTVVFFSVIFSVIFCCILWSSLLIFLCPCVSFCAGLQFDLIS